MYSFAGRSRETRSPWKRWSAWQRWNSGFTRKAGACSCLGVHAHVCFVLFLSGPCLCHHGVICCSGHCWSSRPDGFKGGAGRQWSSREGEIMLNLPCFMFTFIRCSPSYTMFAAWGNCITLEDIIAIYSCRSFDLIGTRDVIFWVFLQGPKSGYF